MAAAAFTLTVMAEDVSYLDRALSASASGDAQAAIDLFRLACAQSPSDALPHFLLGAELAQMRRYAEAEAAYSNAVAFAPEFSLARYELGTLQFTSSRVEAALATWQPLMDLPEQDPLKLFAQGYAFLAQDAFEDALALFELGIACNHANAALNSNIRMLVEEIRKACASRRGIVDGRNEQSGGAHVLLDGYRRQGSS